MPSSAVATPMSSCDFAQAVREALGSASPDHLDDYTDYLFDGVELNNSRVLDIGGGNGIYSLYAAARGARQVVCLEPGADGSSARADEQSRLLRERFTFPQVSFIATTFQDYQREEPRFDVILLKSSINHLDETACIKLQADATARETYRQLLSKLYSLARHGAHVVITDASNQNAFASIHRRSPFAPQVEWHKHHPPEYWTKLLLDVGFHSPHVRWSPVKRFGAVGGGVPATGWRHTSC